MNIKYLFRFFAAVSLLTVFSCAKEIETELAPVNAQEQTGELKTYTMSVVAGKGEAGTRALSLSDDGKTLNATWDAGEKVSVFNKTKNAALTGELEAKTAGESTTLSGTLEGSIDSGDELLLEFLSPGYGTQDGTLEYIATHCDYATATVTATVTGTNVTAGAASFENRQAIVKFTLRDSGDSEDTPVTAMRVSVGDNHYSVNPSSAASVLYVAVPACSAQAITLEGQNGPAYYSYTKSGATFENGKYYSIKVRMAASNDRRFIECSWDEENKTLVQTETSIPLGATIHNISEYSASSSMSDWVVVSGTRTISGYLACSGDVKLILCDGAHLTITGGLAVDDYGSSHNTLTVYCQSYGSSMGKLSVTCSNSTWNGIGGSTPSGTKRMHGAITIHGGDISATGGPNSVGLGSIRRSNDGRTNPITIYGGRVEARAGEVGSGVNALGCPGIGIVGREGNSLIVYGGSVYAYGAEKAAGIGGCEGTSGGSSGIGDGGRVNIYGGYVEAHGGDYGAGIGGGQDGLGGIVTVGGGTVKAYAGTDAAGIGTGEQKNNTINGGSLTVNGGTVEAHGGKYGAGIGGGQDASGATVIINDGTVSAYGGTDAAGIGSGEEVTAGTGAINGGSLTVNGGHVFADGTDVGCGIGGGQDADGATVVINGGTVEAWAGSGDKAAAIGSALGDGHRGSLSIGPGMTVYGKFTDDDASFSHLTYPERVPGCYYRRHSIIRPCDGHEYVDGACKWCGHTGN